MGIPIDKLRTIFWAHRVLEIDGLDGLLKKGKSDKNKIVKLIEERYEKVEPLFKDDDIFDVAMELFFDKASWKRYLSGETPPSYSKEGNFFTNGINRHSYKVNIVETLFPEVKGYYLNGPYGLIDVMSCDNLDDALHTFENNLKSFVNIHEANHVRHEQADIQPFTFSDTWEAIKNRMKHVPENNFDIMKCSLPSLYELPSKWSPVSEAPLFLLMAIGYIEARFMQRFPSYQSVLDGTQLAEIAIFDDEKRIESGILYLEKKYQINRKIWFEDDVFNMARKNILDRGREAFPELAEFDFDNG